MSQAGLCDCCLQEFSTLDLEHDFEYISLHCQICHKVVCENCMMEAEECCLCCFYTESQEHEPLFCEHCVQCKGYTFIDVCKAWLSRNYDVTNSAMTTRSVAFKEGRAQLKWWKLRGWLYVKTVELKDEYRNQRLFTKACQTLISGNNDIECIVLESVLSDELIVKLGCIGWNVPAAADDRNLFMERTK